MFNFTLTPINLRCGPGPDRPGYSRCRIQLLYPAHPPGQRPDHAAGRIPDPGLYLLRIRPDPGLPSWSHRRGLADLSWNSV